MAPTIVAPTRLLRFLERSSTPKLGCHQAPTLSLVYSIVFSCTLSLSEPVHIPVFRSCVSCVILCLPFLYTLPCYVPFLTSDIPALMLCLSIPYRRLPLMYAFDMFKYRL